MTRWTLVASSVLFAACGGGEEADGPPEYGSFSAFGGQQSNPATSPPASNNSSAPGAGQQSNNTGNSAAPPVNPPSNPSEGNPNPAPINNGGMNNGGAMAPGAGGGGSMPGGQGTTPPPPTTPPPVTPPPVTPPPVTPDIACPNGATFCSGFESDALAAGVVFQSNPPAQLQFDTTVKRSGNRSVMFPATSGGFNVRELVVPIPGQSFWVRLFIQTNVLFGDNNHDSLFVASTASPTQDNNAESGPEFSEQGNQVVLNADDQLTGANGPGFPQGAGPQLAANTWHCVEAFFDGGSGDVEVFAAGDSLIDAPGYRRATYQTFRFGYIGFNTPRTVWFDDVVVAPNRVGCN